MVDAGLFITNLIFGAGVPVVGAFGDFDAFLEGEGGQLADGRIWRERESALVV